MCCCSTNFSGCHRIQTCWIRLHLQYDRWPEPKNYLQASFQFSLIWIVLVAEWRLCAFSQHYVQRQIKDRGDGLSVCDKFCWASKIKFFLRFMEKGLNNKSSIFRVWPKKKHATLFHQFFKPPSEKDATNLYIYSIFFNMYILLKALRVASKNHVMTYFSKSMASVYLKLSRACALK